LFIIKIKLYICTNNNKQNKNIMKKTKTGLHIETRKNRIEVYTKKELLEKERKEQEYRNLIITGSILLLGFLIFTFGLIVGSKI